MNVRALIVVPALLLAGVAGARAEEAASSRWSGYVQARETLRQGGVLSASLHRARLALDAKLPPGWSARVSAEYAASAAGGTSGVALRDGYVRGERGPWNLQAGQFKTPMGREYLMSIAAVETADRAAVFDTLAPRRDVGVQLGWSPNPEIEAALGVFNGEGQNVTVNRDSTVLVVGRVAGRLMPGVSLGLSSAAYGGDSTRVGFEFEVEARGARLRGEYLAQEVDGRERRDEGWYALAAYRVRPTWSLVARREHLLRPALDAGRSRYASTTLGVLWEPAGGRIRGILDWVERAAGQEPARRHAWIAQLQGKF
jgi:hypothetical protein